MTQSIVAICVAAGLRYRPIFDKQVCVDADWLVVCQPLCPAFAVISQRQRLLVATARSRDHMKLSIISTEISPHRNINTQSESTDCLFTHSIKPIHQRFTMKLLSAFLASSSIASAVNIPSFRELVDTVQGQSPFASAEQYLIELSPSETRWVTEGEKWALRREGVSFFDITDHHASAARATRKSTVTYPKKPAQNETVSELLRELKKENMKEHLEEFTSFHTRYYKSDYGRQSSEWLLGQVNETLAKAGVGYARHFEHPWGMLTVFPS